LRRRLSSENVSSPYDDRLDKLDPEGTNALPGPTRTRYQSGDRSGSAATSPREGGTPGTGIPGSMSQSGHDITGRPNSRTTSAPTSPLKERASKRDGFLGKVSVFSQVVSQAKDTAAAYKLTGINKNRCFNLLVIDDQNTDWAKYFRGRRVHTDWDIKVDQAEFKDLSVSAGSNSGVSATITSFKSGTKNVTAVKPDILLIRQNLKDANENYKKLLLGFRYAGVPSVNSIESIYNFQDKPWVYAHLLEIQRRVGKENFPLIEQAFYPTHIEMDHKGNYPCVFKIGHAHGGLGKVRVETPGGFQDLASVVAISDQYCTVEDFIDAKYDLHVFKIGEYYKALMRKSLTGNWKTNVGQSILEEIPIQDHHKSWINLVSEMFGGLDICSLEALVTKDGREVIIEVNDCATDLLGESQEEDRKNIAEVVLKTIEAKCSVPQNSFQNPNNLDSVTNISNVKEGHIQTPSRVPPPIPQRQLSREVSRKQSETESGAEESPVRASASRRTRSDSEDSSDSESSTVSESSHGSPRNRRNLNGKQNPFIKEAKDNADTLLDGEDTMKDLRTTFAGIFGERK